MHIVHRDNTVKHNNMVNINTSVIKCCLVKLNEMHKNENYYLSWTCNVQP